MIRRSHRNAILIAIALISLAMHFRHFSKELVSIHVWRQTQTQSNIINFYEGDMNIFNPAKNDRGDGNGIFRMEFPLMQWLVAATYRIFGNHLIITRIFMFVLGLFTLTAMYKLIFALSGNEIMALAGAWAFNFSPSFFYFTINPIPDNMALCCATWGLALFFTWIRKDKFYLLVISGLMLSLGALCKLPFILYFIAPVSWLAITVVQKRTTRGFGAKLLVIVLALAPPLAWYATVVPQWDITGIVHGMFRNDIPLATIFDYLWFNLISTLPELLLNYGAVLFFLAGIYYLVKNKGYARSVFPMLALPGIAVIAYFLFELNMIGNVHDYYLFPFMPFLFVLVAYGAGNFLRQKSKVFRYMAVMLLMVLPLTAYLRMMVRWNVDSPGFNKDLLTYKEDLRRAVPKDALCVAGNDNSHYIFFYYIDKKGWAFQNDSLPAASLVNMIEKGAAYLYSDSRVIDADTGIERHLDTLLLERGSVRVYRLKRSL